LSALLLNFKEKTMINYQLTQQLSNEFESKEGNKLIPDNNPIEFAVFLYEKLLKSSVPR
jgi:hypothetical protein